MPRPVVNSQQVDALSYIHGLLEEHKRAISIHYSEAKLRLPTYLKLVTIRQLRDLGATVDPDISLPRGAEDGIRKVVFINEKMKDIREQYIAQVTKFYDDIRKTLPRELLDKKLSDLSDEEWSQLGINMDKFRAKYPNQTD